MCLYPKIIPNPRYKPNKKNGGNIPPIQDKRTSSVPITCGNCIECRKQKARNWQIRLLEEIKTTKNGHFITLTFNDESIQQIAKTTTVTGYALDNYIATQATRMFLERWRKTHGKSLRHWLITELGHNGTNNIHLHGIIWLQEKNDIHKIDSHWKYGYVWKGTKKITHGGQTEYNNYVNENTIAYIIKYVTKSEEKYKYYKPVILCSPGIGNNYTKNTTGNVKRNTYKNTETKDTYITTTGHEISLPKYYKNKIYTDEQKEQLWINKLNQQKRYVLGKEIDISQTEETYLSVLQHAREYNARLGYGTNKTDIEQRTKEQLIRLQMQITRIKKGERKILLKQIKSENLPQAPF